jgi:CheY-like chemotaxis protein
MGDFLVMEFVDGTDLGEITNRTGPLSVPHAISAIRQAALALGYAHQQGIVHRDIKPANLLRDVSGCVKVVDLGLARLSQWEETKGAELTQLGSVAGTVDFMSPEQAENPLEVDGRSDIYSLGCTLFYLLTGGALFPRSSILARVLAHRSEPPPALSSIRRDVPLALDTVFQRMVAKCPSNRFASMEEVVIGLDSVNRTQADEQPAKAVSKAVNEAWVPSKATVLVVEESRLQCNMIRNVLTEIGVQDVHFCQSGNQALERLATTSSTVLLSSMRLPDMSGLELAAQIRDTLRWLEIGIVLMSADDWTSQSQASAQRLGRLRLLKKPFDADKLRIVIAGALTDNLRDQQPIAGLNELRVLIVDDSNLARIHAQHTLAELGFSRFTQADDGDTAVKLMQETRFDLVVTDYRMPRMDGRELISFIRGRSTQKDVPIIMVTTEFDPKKLAAIYQLGVSAISNKSFDREMVRNIVIQLFAGGET